MWARRPDVLRRDGHHASHVEVDGAPQVDEVSPRSRRVVLGGHPRVLVVALEDEVLLPPGAQEATVVVRARSPPGGRRSRAATTCRARARSHSRRSTRPGAPARHVRRWHASGRQLGRSSRRQARPGAAAARTRGSPGARRPSRKRSHDGARRGGPSCRGAGTPATSGERRSSGSSVPPRITPSMPYVSRRRPTSADELLARLVAELPLQQLPMYRACTRARSSASGTTTSMPVPRAHRPGRTAPPS